MVFWIRCMFQPYRTKVNSGLSNYWKELHLQIDQHGTLLMAIPHSTWAGKKWECLLLVIVCLVGIIMNNYNDGQYWYLTAVHMSQNAWYVHSNICTTTESMSELWSGIWAEEEGREGRQCDQKRSNRIDGWSNISRACTIKLGNVRRLTSAVALLAQHPDCSKVILCDLA